MSNNDNIRHRSAVIKGKFISEGSENFDNKIRNENLVSLSKRQRDNLIIPVFSIEFESYDPFPSMEMVKTIKSELREVTADNHIILRMMDKYNSSDVYSTKPEGKPETESVPVAECIFIQSKEQQDPMIMNVDMKNLKNII